MPLFFMSLLTHTHVCLSQARRRMAALRRASSSGPPLPAALVAQRGTLIALGAVGLSLGAAWAWQCSKRSQAALESPSCGANKKKVLSQRKHRTKRQKSRGVPSGEVAVHESSEEDLPVTPNERCTSAVGMHPDVDANEQSHPDMERSAEAATREPPATLSARGAQSGPSKVPFPAADASGGVEVARLSAEADSTTAGEFGQSDVSGETAGEGQWIPVERKQRRGKKAAGVVADGLTGESQVPEDTEGAQGDGEQSGLATATRDLQVIAAAVDRQACMRVGVQERFLSQSHPLAEYPPYPLAE